MSRFFNDSPAKKAKPSESNFQTVGEVVPNRFCPDPECKAPNPLLVKYKGGRAFVVCAKNDRDDLNSCQFTANKFGRDRGKGESKIACVCCGVPVAGVLSLGKVTGEVDPDTNKPLYDNVHLFFDECVGRRDTDPLTKKRILSQCTTASGDIVGTVCAAYREDEIFVDLKEGCTGPIHEGDTIVRFWALKDPAKGLHARCAKRMHAALIAEIIAEKKYRKKSGTTAEDEAKAPSAEITEDLEDF